MNDFTPMQEIAFNEHPWPNVPHLVLTPTEDTDRACLESLIDVTTNLQELFNTHPAIDVEEPWFGWAFKRLSGLQSEMSLFDRAAKDSTLHPLIELYVQRVIENFQDTDGEPGFYVHEEKEAGSDAILALMRVNFDKYCETYIEYLKAVDLEHTVAQSDNIRILSAILPEQKLKQLRDLLGTLSGGEYMPDI